MDNKGITIRGKDVPGQVSVTIGSTKVETRGKPVQVRFTKQTAFVFLVIDCSGSMAGYKLEEAKKGILDFARDAFTKEYMVGLISFDSTARLICEPTHDISVLQQGLEQLQPIGSTNMSEAIMMAYNNLKKHQSVKVIVLATDGKPDNELDALTAGDIVKKEKIDIITIGTDDADREFLKKLASRSQLARKVSKEEFSQAISSTAMMLPAPKNITRR